MAEHKLEIFRVLGELDKKNIKFFDSLSEEEKKAFQPLVVSRWLSGTSNKQQLFLLNEIVNPYIFSLAKHKPLLYKLMTICTAGSLQRYVWNKQLSKGSTHPFTTKTIQQYFGYNSRDAEKVIPLLLIDDISTMAEDMGWQDEDLNKLRKELGLPTIRKPRASSKSGTQQSPDILEL
jgi:hypothetical protein